MPEIQVPLTVVEATIEVPIYQSAPKLLREESTAGDSKISGLPQLFPIHVQPTDLLPVARASQWTRHVTVQDLGTAISAFVFTAAPYTLTRAALTMVSGTTLQLGTEAVVRLSAASQVDTLTLQLPLNPAPNQRVEVLFRQKVAQLVPAVAAGQQDRPADNSPLQSIAVDTTGLDGAIGDIGTTVLFEYDRSTTTWRVGGVWARYDTPSVKDPVRDLCAKFDGSTVVTAKYQASVTAAKQAAVGGLAYGLGGTVRGQVGVALCGPLTWSRWVSFEGIGALGSHTIRSDYSARAGVPGTDAQITMADDGSGQAGIVGQQRFHNLAMDGRRSSLVGGPLATHVRHGLLFPDPTDGTDRVCSVGDLQIMNYPGDGWQVVNNGQVRGGNVKLTGNKRNINWSKVKDGKVDQLGSGSADQGNLFSDCASLKFGKVDFWTGSNSDGTPLCTWASCAKLVIGEGEAEGMWVFLGDNNQTNSKSYRAVLMNTAQSINFKVSEDYFASPAGAATNITTGAGYVAHVKVVDHFGLRLPNCSFGYKLSNPPTPGMLAATPPFAIWFGTQVATSDPDYASYLDQCGYVDVTSTAFLWHDGKAVSGVPSKPICAYKLAPSNMMKNLHGYRVGTIHERITGTQPSDEIACDGAQYTSDYYPLLYIAVTGGVLTDRDASGAGSSGPNGYKTFNVPNLPTGNGITTKYMVYKQ